MRKLFIISALLMLFSNHSIGQQMNDTLVMFLEEKVEMKIIIDNYKRLKIDSTQLKLREKLKHFQEVLAVVSNDLDPEVAELIVFSEENELKVSPGDPTRIYLVGEEVKPSGIRDKAVLKLADMEVIFTSTQMELLNNVGLIPCYDSMIQKIPESSRYSKTHYFECNGSEVVLIAEKEEVHSRGDVIEITAGGGLNVYKGQLLGELGVRMDLVFFKKNVLQHNPYLSWTLLYDFSEFDKMHINQFLNVGYSWDRGRGKEDTEDLHFGVELGFLINRNGNLFEKNTTRFGINWSPAPGITVSPQMYIIGGFEELQPGFRIGLGF